MRRERRASVSRARSRTARQEVKRLYVLTFDKVVAAKDKTAVKYYWTRDEILRGDQLKWYRALTEEELANGGLQVRSATSGRPESMCSRPRTAADRYPSW